MPESMIKGIDSLSRDKNCSSNTIIKLAIAKFLFDQDLPSPKVGKNEYRQIQSNDISREIPVDKIIAVQYTLNDGRIIHIMRQSKLR